MFIALGHTVDVAGSIVPPLLGQQKALVYQVVGPALPALVIEPVVMRQRLDAARRVRVAGELIHVNAKAHRLAGGLLGQLHLFAGCTHQMRAPSKERGCHPIGRHSQSEARQMRIGRAVEALGAVAIWHLEGGRMDDFWWLRRELTARFGVLIGCFLLIRCCLQIWCSAGFALVVFLGPWSGLRPGVGHRNLSAVWKKRLASGCD